MRRCAPPPSEGVRKGTPLLYTRVLIVVMDNLSTHTGDKVRQAIEARGCQLLFLPSYYPDLSPIEESFSKLKAFLRRVGARTP